MLNTELKKELKKNLTGIKNLVKEFDNLEDLHKSFEFVFEKVTNRKDNKYKGIYNIQQVFESKTIKEYKQHLKDNKTIIIEFVKVENAPKQLIIIFNGFDKETQTFIDFYILKGDK